MFVKLFRDKFIDEFEHQIEINTIKGEWEVFGPFFFILGLVIILIILIVFIHFLEKFSDGNEEDMEKYNENQILTMKRMYQENYISQLKKNKILRKKKRKYKMMLSERKVIKKTNYFCNDKISSNPINSDEENEKLLFLSNSHLN